MFESQFNNLLFSNSKHSSGTRHSNYKKIFQNVAHRAFGIRRNTPELRKEMRKQRNLRRFYIENPDEHARHLNAEEEKAREQSKMQHLEKELIDAKIHNAQVEEEKSMLKKLAQKAAEAKDNLISMVSSIGEFEGQESSSEYSDEVVEKNLEKSSSDAQKVKPILKPRNRPSPIANRIVRFATSAKRSVSFLLQGEEHFTVPAASKKETKGIAPAKLVEKKKPTSSQPHIKPQPKLQTANKSKAPETIEKASKEPAVLKLQLSKRPLGFSVMPNEKKHGAHVSHITDENLKKQGLAVGLEIVGLNCHSKLQEKPFDEVIRILKTEPLPLAFSLAPAAENITRPKPVEQKKTSQTQQKIALKPVEQAKPKPAAKPQSQLPKATPAAKPKPEEPKREISEAPQMNTSSTVMYDSSGSGAASSSSSC